MYTLFSYNILIITYVISALSLLLENYIPEMILSGTLLIVSSVYHIFDFLSPNIISIMCFSY